MYQSKLTRECDFCFQPKPHSAFRGQWPNLRSTCNECLKLRNVLLRFQNAESLKICNTCSIEKQRKEFGISTTSADGWMHKCNACEVARGRLRKTFWTQEEFVEALVEQEGKCYICKSKLKDSKDTVADHNSKTKKPRKILCRSCNIGLGHFNENPVALRAAADYLEEHNG